MRLLLLTLCVFSVACPLKAQRRCETAAYLNKLVKDNVSIAQSVQQANDFLNNRIHEPRMTASGVIQNSYQEIIIPVVVHIVYNNFSQNISNAQILSQIEVLNEDYNRQNADTSNTPAAFYNLAADVHIRFKLATTDPSGNPTAGILRRQTSIQYFGIDDRIKSTAIGGDDPWDADRYLNIWVCNLAGGIIGYSSVLGGPKEKDGVVIRYDAFGTTGKAKPPFNGGRTCTHEIGHWLGLQHIWGDQYCGDDHVDDTPPQQMATHGCPSGTIPSCSNHGNMYVNFMDFTDDACVNMFTVGQRDRMRAVFKPGGPRNAILFSAAAAGDPGLLPDDAPLQPDPPAVKIYPNPSEKEISIPIREQAKMIGQPVVIYNQLGQPTKRMLIGKQMIRINISSLKPGLYFISIGERKIMSKFIKN